MSAAFIPAPETLRALQQSWSTSPAESRPGPHGGFLSLRDIPQIPFDDAHAVFSMSSLGYPAEWKEQVRQLRNRLNDAQSELEHPDDLLQVLAFTNMDGRRHRHSTAANLALAMASIQDTRVLVVDANPSNPTMHHALGIAPGPGLCEATRAERATLPACFRRVTGTQVYLLQLGDTSAQGMGPLDLGGFHSLLRSLRAQFDWIILDGPGFDTPDDAMTVSMAADGVIMMIEREQDSFREVARALGQVQGRRLLGAVMF